MMKQADKKEIDLVLRNVAKNNRGMLDDPAAVRTDHLDADELSSYAEDVLPSATRARYTAHLADCENCRKMVSALAMASGAPMRVKDEAAATGSSFWRNLGELFSPAVLRYAIPALALLAVIAVAFVSTRRDNNFVASNEQTASTPTSANGALPNKPLPNDQARQSQLPTESPRNPERAETSDRAARTTDQGSTSDKRAPEQTRSKEDAADSVATTQPSYAPEPAPPPPAQNKPAGNVGGAATAREQGQKDKEVDAVDRDETVTVSKNQVNDAPAAAPKTKALSVAGRIAGERRVADLEEKKAENETAKNSKSNARVTRRVAGRSFYQDGNVWIDEAYNSSQAVTIVHRGSEQYRALMADEPSLKSIDQALGGTVIIVWKGRAYRIQ